MLEDILLREGYSEVNAREVYTDLYHFGEDYVQRIGQIEPGVYKHFNPLAYGFNEKYVPDPKDKTKQIKLQINCFDHIVLQDNLDIFMPSLQKRDVGLLDACGYYGKNYKEKHLIDKNGNPIRAKNPQIMFGIITEIDNVTEVKLENLLTHINKLHRYPMPNYIACSGGGLHLYFVLKEPFRIDTQTKLEMMNYLKKRLMLRMWNPATSENKNPQSFEGIVQPYRVIGGKSKPIYKDHPIVRAFHTHSERYTLEELKEYARQYIDGDPVEYSSLDFDTIFYKQRNRFSLEYWKEKNPEWYQRRIIEKQPPAKKGYIVNPAVYKHELKLVKEQAVYGFRYMGVKMLAITALQCGIPFEKLKDDVLELVPYLDSLDKDHPFHEYEALKAIESYKNDKNRRMTVKKKHELANIKAEPKKKRNPPGQRLTRRGALKLANYKKQLLKEAGSYVEKGGRKDTETRNVLSYFAENGFLAAETEEEFDKQIRGKVSEIAREVNVSRPTVYRAIKILKWFNKWIDDEGISQADITNTLKSMNEMITYLKNEGVIDGSRASFKGLEFNALNEEQRQMFIKICLKYKIDIYHLWPKQLLSRD